MTGTPLERTEIDLIALGNRVRELRADRNVSIEALARRSGIELDLLTRLDKRDITVPIAMRDVLALSKGLNTTMDYLLSGRIVEDGAVTIIACGRRRKRCACGRIATKKCDFPLSGAKGGTTCDADICDGCATPIGPNVDYCGPHDRLAKKRAKENRPI